MFVSQDSFNDVELTSLAIEIIKDLSEDKPLDTNDAFIHKLARDIEEDTVVDMDLSPSLYSGGDSLFSAVTTPSTQLTVGNISYPRLSPTILSSCQLSRNDSFNQSLPPIPTALVPSPNTMAKSKSCPRPRMKRKKRVSSHSKRHMNNASHSAVTVLHKENTSNDISPKCNSSRFSSPYHPPPQYALCHLVAISSVTVSNEDESDTSNISSCISPRHAQKTKICAVPQFNEFTDVVVINLSPRHKGKSNDDKKKVFFAENVEKKRKTSKDNKYRGIKRGRSVTQINIKKPKLRLQNSCGGKPQRTKKWRSKSNIDIWTREKKTQYNDRRVLCDDFD